MRRASVDALCVVTDLFCHRWFDGWNMARNFWDAGKITWCL